MAVRDQINVIAPLDDLTRQTNGVRFLRHAYTDPMNKDDGSWRFIYVGPNGQLIGSLGSQSLLQNVLKESRMYRSSVGCMVFGVVGGFIISLLGASAFRLETAFSQLNQLIPLGILNHLLRPPRHSDLDLLVMTAATSPAIGRRAHSRPQLPLNQSGVAVVLKYSFDLDIEWRILVWISD